MPYLVAAALVVFSYGARAQALSLDVPARSAWCVASQPIVLGADQGPNRFGDLVFYELYRRLESEALRAGLPSIGVPFLQSVKEQVQAPAAPAIAAPSSPSAAPAAAPTAPAAPPPPPKYVLRVCANTPTSTPAPAVESNVSRVVFAAARVFAALCASDDDAPCRQQVQAKVKADLQLSPERLAALDWHVSQSIDGAATSASFLASLTDFSARGLQAGQAMPKLPRDRIVIWVSP